MLSRTEAEVVRKEVIEMYPEEPVEVVALDTGYYDHELRKMGEVFIIAKAEDFSGIWMQLTSEGEVKPDDSPEARYPVAMASHVTPRTKPGKGSEHQDKKPGKAKTKKAAKKAE